MNQKVVFAFLIVAVSAVLARPGIARDDALVPAVIAADAVPAPEVPASEAPAAAEEQPTSPPALSDEAVTAEAVTLPAQQEGSLPAAESESSNDNVAIPIAALPAV